MPNQTRVRAVFPGAFDPFTLGHLDVIHRGAPLFGELIVAVGENPAKEHFFPLADRLEMIQQLVADIPNVRVDSYNCLTVEYVKKIKADVILRGIRTLSDYHYEFTLALTNRSVAGVETIFIMSSEQYAHLSSSLIKEVATLGGDISAFLPPPIIKRVKAKFDQHNNSSG
ncbi:MAG: pantetheine-phosphate adenylyltransferase [Actinobacteria bacterium]|nr:pantetheine-phosphate adenylyltransferase [Actinomycetota bacterium]